MEISDGVDFFQVFFSTLSKHLLTNSMGFHGQFKYLTKNTFEKHVQDQEKTAKKRLTKISIRVTITRQSNFNYATENRVFERNSKFFFPH